MTWGTEPKRTRKSSDSWARVELELYPCFPVALRRAESRFRYDLACCWVKDNEADAIGLQMRERRNGKQRNWSAKETHWSREQSQNDVWGVGRFKCTRRSGDIKPIIFMIGWFSRKDFLIYHHYGWGRDYATLFFTTTAWRQASDRERNVSASTATNLSRLTAMLTFS